MNAVERLLDERPSVGVVAEKAIAPRVGRERRVPVERVRQNARNRAPSDDDERPQCELRRDQQDDHAEEAAHPSSHYHAANGAQPSL